MYSFFDFQYSFNSSCSAEDFVTDMAIKMDGFLM